MKAGLLSPSVSYLAWSMEEDIQADTSLKGYNQSSLLRLCVDLVAAVGWRCSQHSACHVGMKGSLQGCCPPAEGDLAADGIPVCLQPTYLPSWVPLGQHRHQANIKLK